MESPVLNIMIVCNTFVNENENWTNRKGEEKWQTELC